MVILRMQEVLKMHNMLVSIVAKEQQRIHYKISVPEKSSTIEYKKYQLHSFETK